MRDNQALIKNYCEYLTFRSFYTGLPKPEVDLPFVKNIEDAKQKLSDVLGRTEKPALLLSGGMDSAVFVPYVPKDTTAYTIYHENLDYSEVDIAKKYCDKYSIKHVAISIDPEESMSVVDELMINKKMPLSPAEPMFYLAAKRAAKDGCKDIITGGTADTRFGGFCRFRQELPSSKYQKKLFKRYHNPQKILKNHTQLDYLFDEYLIPMRQKKTLTDFMRSISPRKKDRCIIDSRRFLQEVSIERFAFNNAISMAGCKHIAPFSSFLFDFDESQNMKRPKYFIQDLYESIYGCEPPKKLGLQKPTFLLKDYSPTNLELFKENINTAKMSYPKKFLLFCLERFEELRQQGLV